jgi:hypothetical protein
LENQGFLEKMPPNFGLGTALRKIEQRTAGHYRVAVLPEDGQGLDMMEAEKLLAEAFAAPAGSPFITKAYRRTASGALEVLRRPSLWTWVGTDGKEVGIARLAQAWIPLGAVNLVGFHEATLRDLRLVGALRRQADLDGQAVRLVRFEAAEELALIEPDPRPRLEERVQEEGHDGQAR